MDVLSGKQASIGGLAGQCLPNVQGFPLFVTDK
jgi:hypothetical protein